MDFFPDYKVKKGEKTIFEVTVRHLLTMTAPYKYRSEPWKKVCTSPDWTLAALDHLGGRKGITGEFRYATLGIQILAGIIERASGEKCIDFAKRIRIYVRHMTKDANWHPIYVQVRASLLNHPWIKFRHFYVHMRCSFYFFLESILLKTLAQYLP
jgi:hypothetical protein